MNHSPAAAERSKRRPGFSPTFSPKLWVAGAFGATLLAIVALRAAPLPPDTCSNLKSTLSMPHTTINSAETVPAGTFSPANRGGANAKPVTGLPTFCRVTATLAPTSDSKIGVEVWMPTSGWNGKLQAIGNHELGGVIFYGDMGAELKRNFAVASTDTGHTETADASWASGHPEKMADFGWRAVHEMTVTAKAVVSAFYGANARYSYFNGCSSGGREALKEAQKFPDDYDGIISGSAMNYWTHSHLVHIWEAQAMLKDGIDGASYLPPSKYPLVINAALAQCRARDSEAPGDDFLVNPSRCDWSPKTLVCQAGQDPNTCISAAQAQALEKIYAGWRNSKTKEEIYPGATRTSVPSWAAWATRPGTSPDGLTANGPAQQYLQWLAFDNPKWDWRTLNFDSDVALTDASDAKGPQINAIDPDLRGFQKRGGKLIEYHGWVDPGFSPEYAVQYYESAVRAVRKNAGVADEDAALSETQKFYRLFMVPGMGHCTGGPGPNAFGGLAQPAAPLDPQHDLVSALEQWVEGGVAPAQITATKYVKDDPAQGIAMQRPICAYPEEPHYKGSGSTADTSNFMCVKPPDAKRTISQAARP
jgi:Tannase and feruloyl esterase